MVMSTFGNGFSGKMVYMSTSGKGFIEKTFSVSTFIDKYSEVRILLRFSDIFVHYNLALFGFYAKMSLRIMNVQKKDLR